MQLDRTLLICACAINFLVIVLLRDSFHSFLPKKISKKRNDILLTINRNIKILYQNDFLSNILKIKIYRRYQKSNFKMEYNNKMRLNGTPVSLIWGINELCKRLDRMESNIAKMQKKIDKLETDKIQTAKPDIPSIDEIVSKPEPALVKDGWS